MKAILCLLALAGGLFADTNLTGKWTGTFTPENGDEGPALLQLKQTGTDITGSIGPDDNEQHNGYHERLHDHHPVLVRSEDQALARQQL